MVGLLVGPYDWAILGYNLHSIYSASSVALLCSIHSDMFCAIVVGLLFGWVGFYGFGCGLGYWLGYWLVLMIGLFWAITCILLIYDRAANRTHF